jgi:hypothetical protein
MSQNTALNMSNTQPYIRRCFLNKLMTLNHVRDPQAVKMPVTT